MNEAGGKEDILSLIDRIDNKNMLLAACILEIHRLRQLCRAHGIDPRATKSPEKDTP